METNTETDQTADTDASESNLAANRRRRSRRRRTDEDTTLMDGESDNASMSENGTGGQVTAHSSSYAGQTDSSEIQVERRMVKMEIIDTSF